MASYKNAVRNAAHEHNIHEWDLMQAVEVCTNWRELHDAVGAQFGIDNEVR